MAENERLGASFSIDVTDLKAGLKTANKLIRESESEFKAAAAGMDDWGRSEEGLKAKIKSLTDITEIQRKKVDALQGEYDDLVRNGMDPTSDAAVELRTKINKEKEALAKNEKELRNQTDALEELGNEADDAGEEVEDVGESAKKSGDGFTIAKGAIADLISNGLQALVGACKNAISSIANLAEETREYRENLNKLESAFETSGFTAFEAQTQYSSLYRVLGDNDKATEASAHLAKLATTQEDLSKWTNICTGVYGAFGDSLPIEGLTEAANEVAKTGELTGVLTDAINWATTDQNVWNSALGEGTAQQKAFAKGIKEGMSAEDAFKEALAACTTEQERADLITRTLNGLYSESADTFREVNASVMDANTAQDRYNKATADLGEKIEPVMTAIKNGFADIVFAAGELTEGIDFEGLSDKINTAFTKFIDETLPKIIDGLQWIKDNKDTLIAGVAGIGAAFATFKVASMIMGVVDAIKAFQLANEGATVAQALLNTTMLANPVGLITVAVGALVAAIVLLIKNWDSVKEAALICWDAIKQAASAVADWFSEKWAAVSEWFSELWDGIKEKASAVWEGIKAVFSTVATWFDENVIQPVKAFFEPLFKVIGELAEGCWILIQTVWGIVASWFDENVIQPVKNFFSETWDAISQKASDAWQKIKDVFAAVSGWFSENVTQPIKNFFSETWNNVKEKASQAWEKIKSVFSPVSDWFKDKFSTAWKKVKDVFSTGGEVFGGIVEGIEKAFKKVVNAIIRGVNKTIAIPFNAINNMLDKIRNVSIAGVQPFSGLITRFNVPEIPELAKGGVVRSATNAIIGEDGDEAVVPLEKNTEWMDKLADKIASKNKSVVVNQTNNYSQAHSRYELYKSKKQTTAAVRLALQEV